jgi:hypothetical protein
MIAGYKEEAPLVVTIAMSLLVSHAVANDCVVATGLDDITLRTKDGPSSIATSASRMSGYFATASGSVLPSNSYSLTHDR